MGVKFDFSDVHRAIGGARNEVKRKFDDAGREAVEYNMQNGSYIDRTGNLRRSNYYNATETTLEIGNSADYASNVESKGYEVASSGFLQALRKLGI